MHTSYTTANLQSEAPEPTELATGTANNNIDRLRHTQRERERERGVERHDTACQDISKRIDR